MSYDAAAAFLAQKKLEDPERYAEVCRKYPVQSSHNEKRDTDGISPWIARQQRGPSGGVPREHKRTFTDEEWAEVQEARRIGRRELKIDYLHALQLVTTGEE